MRVHYDTHCVTGPTSNPDEQRLMVYFYAYAALSAAFYALK